MVLLVVSCWSWGSQTFPSLILDPCVSAAEAGAAMEALVRLAYLDTEIVTASISLCLFSHLCFASCVKMVYGAAVQCSPCSLCLCMYPMCGLDWPLLAGRVGDGNLLGYYFWCCGSIFSCYGGILGSVCVFVYEPSSSSLPMETPKILCSRCDRHDGRHPAIIISLLVLWVSYFYSFSLSALPHLSL